MSTYLLDLAQRGEFDTREFIDRLAGLYRQCQHISTKAAQLERQTAQRVAGIRLNTFKGLAEIGECLLLVQERREGEFQDWFETHQERLGFSLRHAVSCKSAARAVREVGLEAAFAQALEKAHRQAPPPSIRVPVAVDGMPEDKAREIFERLRPVYHALELRFAPRAA